MRQVQSETAKRIVAGCGGVVIAYMAMLALLFHRGAFLLDAHGHPLFVDFIEVWVAGRFVLQGHPAAPYDWHVHHAAQVAVIGHPVSNYLGWHYPPLFLLVAAGLALLSYVPSFLAWITATALVYAGTIWKVTGRHEAALVALAMPAAFGCALVGQNGFVTAAILGAALLALEKRPWFAGLFIGLLTYKPQFGLLFPIVLLFEGNWRAVASAAIATIMLLAVSWFAFGTAPFAAFLDHLPGTASKILNNGAAGFEKLQSVFGLLRWLGADATLAWVGHGAVTLAAALGVLWLWKQPVSYSLKAAAFATAAIVATPYLYLYDLPMLAVPFAFLFRDRAFDPMEIAVTFAANLLMVVFVWAALPIGPALTLVPVALVVRRAVGLSPGLVALQRA